MKQVRFIFYGLFMALLYACTENRFESLPVSGGPDGELIEVSLALESMPVKVIGEEWKAEEQGIDTRQADATNVDENAINNIWVFQYNSGGTLMTAPRYYSMASSSATASLKVMLRPAVNCQIYVIANTNDANWANGITIGSNVSRLTSKTFTRSTETEMYG